jgi:hypothetical protein
MQVNKEKTTTSGWTQANSLSFGMETTVGISIDFITASTTYSTNFTTEYGKQFSQSEAITVGTGATVNTTVKPG